tara:strand:- start:927 stop:1052 length:126 start_codon:yes stop_codon:yes gene_type:complete
MFIPFVRPDCAVDLAIQNEPKTFKFLFCNALWASEDEYASK